LVIERGSICWAELPGSGDRRPVLVVQADAFNRSRIPTVVVLPLVRNLRLREAPGNVLVPANTSGLGKDSVVNVAQPVTLERRLLRPTPNRLDGSLLGAVTEGLRLVLGL
jgi:mRNA interferase MazF